MKRIFSLFLILFLIMSCIGAFASGETKDRLMPLSNKTIKSILEKNGYKGWELYQPSSRETETNTSSKSFLSKIDQYSIVAMKKGQTHLIVLQKRNSNWEMDVISDKAIARDGFRLFSFSMDENIGSGDNTIYFYFDFADAEDGVYTLRLDLSLQFPNYFRFLSLPQKKADSGYIYQEIVMDYDRNFTFELDVYGGAYRESVSVEPWQHYQFGIEEFSLADMPLSILDLTKPATVKAGTDKAGLYRYPMDHDEPIRMLSEGELVNIVPLEYGRGHWMIVCDGDNVYYAPSDLFEY